MLRIALPNKGRLSERALELFERAGLAAEPRASRSLQASLGSDFRALFVRAADVAEFVSDGAADLGVTGADLVRESGRDLTELLDLGFGRCRLVVAVRDESPVTGPADIPAGTRVASSFPGITRSYFEGLGIPVEVAPVSGAAEIAPHLGVADVIVDLTSTGSTLRVNGLREVGTVMESSARLVAAPGIADGTESPQEAGPGGEGVDDTALEEAAVGSAARVRELIAALQSVLNAERKRYLMANVPRDRLEEVREVLPGLSGPTVVEVLDEGRWVAAHAVVEADRVYRTIARLKELGAEGILVTRIERLMP